MCRYVAHWNIFMVIKRDLQQKKEEKKRQGQIISTPKNMALVSDWFKGRKLLSAPE